MRADARKAVPFEQLCNIRRLVGAVLQYQAARDLQVRCRPAHDGGQGLDPVDPGVRAMTVSAVSFSSAGSAAAT